MPTTYGTLNPINGRKYRVDLPSVPAFLIASAPAPSLRFYQGDIINGVPMNVPLPPYVKINFGMNALLPNGTHSLSPLIYGVRLNDLTDITNQPIHHYPDDGTKVAEVAQAKVEKTSNAPIAETFLGMPKTTGYVVLGLGIFIAVGAGYYYYKVKK